MPANRIRRWPLPRSQRTPGPDPYGPAAGTETVTLIFAAMLLLLILLLIYHLWL